METTENLAGKVAVYMRVGSPEQIRSVVGYARCAVQNSDGQELKKQTAKVLELAAANGLEIKPENIVAEYGSGSDMAARSGLQDLLRRAEDGEVGTVVVISPDRLSRNSSDVLSILKTLSDSGVSVISKNGVLNSSDPFLAFQPLAIPKRRRRK